MSWISYGPENEYSVGALERHDGWCPEYFWYAVALAIIVFIVFSLIEALIKRKSRI